MKEEARKERGRIWEGKGEEGKGKKSCPQPPKTGDATAYNACVN